MYVYRRGTGLNNYQIRLEEQRRNEEIIRKRKKYRKLKILFKDELFWILIKYKFVDWVIDGYILWFFYMFLFIFFICFLQIFWKMLDIVVSFYINMMIEDNYGYVGGCLSIIYWLVE